MWIQNYDPFGYWPVSTLVASLPVLVLLGLLASGKASAWQAAMAGLITAIGVAWREFGMPVTLAVASAGYGVVFAWFRIIWLVIAAVFLYDITVATGQFEVMRASIARLSNDRRIQAVLVAFCLGAILEGAAGFGAPVAIAAALLVGLGFDPFQAGLLCLIANTAPVAWGSIGVPIRTLAAVTSLDVEALSATAGRIVPIWALIIPFWIVAVMSGLRGAMAVWPILLVVGGTFAGVQFLWSNGAAVFGWTFTSFELVNVVAAVASLMAGVLLLAFWQPRAPTSPQSDDLAVGAEKPPAPAPVTPPAWRVARAWAPFALIALMVLVWGIPDVKRWMAAPHAVPGSARVIHLEWKSPMPRLHRTIARGPALTGHAPTPDDLEGAEMEIVPVSSTGTAVFLAAVLSGFMLGVGPRRLAVIFGRTLRRLAASMAAISGMLAIGFVTKYSGMDTVLGLALTHTGPLLYPVFGTLLGWLGVALTGSDTSSNVLFGNLQTVTAAKLGLSPILMAAANAAGGMTGKMIAAQSIVVAAAASGETGKEGKLLRAVFGHSLVMAIGVGLTVWAFAHLWPGLVVNPTGR